MSWFVTSISNSLKLLDDVDVDPTTTTTSTSAGSTPISPRDEPQPHDPPPPPIDASSSPRRGGVKDDLSELSKTLTRQFWGVASFLAPPPPSHLPDPIPDDVPRAYDDIDSPNSSPIGGIRSDLSEIGGRFRTGIAKLSNNKAVEELTKIATSILQIGGEEEEYEEREGEGDGAMEEYGKRGVVGVTEDVVAFARDVALHPETWLDFPLFEDVDEEEEDFELSDVQQEHALAVEHLAPRLAALRIELCPGYMSEGSFWKIYFVLVHPRLSKDDALLLSTPPIMEARAMLTREYQNRAKPRLGNSRAAVASVATTDAMPTQPSGEGETVPIEVSAFGSSPSSVAGNLDVDKHQVTNTEIPIIDKEVVDEGPINKSNTDSSASTSYKGVNQKYEDDADDDADADDWLKEENPEIAGVSGTAIPLSNDEDVSFSDLEDDDEDGVPSGYKKATNTDASRKDSRDWVTLNSKSANSGKDVNIEIKRSGKDKESNLVYEDKEISGWLDFEDIDST